MKSWTALLRSYIECLDRELHGNEASSVVARKKGDRHPVQFVSPGKTRHLRQDVSAEGTVSTVNGYFLITERSLRNFLSDSAILYGEECTVEHLLHALAIRAVWEKNQYLQFAVCNRPGLSGLCLSARDIFLSAHGLLSVAEQDIERDLNGTMQMYMRKTGGGRHTAIGEVEYDYEKASQIEYLCRRFAEAVCIANVTARCNSFSEKIKFLQQCWKTAMARVAEKS